MFGSRDEISVSSSVSIQRPGLRVGQWSFFAVFVIMRISRRRTSTNKVVYARCRYECEERKTHNQKRAHKNSKDYLCRDPIFPHNFLKAREKEKKTRVTVEPTPSAEGFLKKQLLPRSRHRCLQ